MRKGSSGGQRGERAAAVRGCEEAGRPGEQRSFGPFSLLSFILRGRGRPGAWCMATELRCLDSMPCHNQQVNCASTQNPEPQQAGELIPDHAGGNSDFAGKLTLLRGRVSSSSVPAERDSQACGGATLNSESNGGTGNSDAPASDSLLGDCELSRQIGAQLKLLPMNDQIRELQTIIRDK